MRQFFIILALGMNLIFLSCGGNNSGISTFKYDDPGDGDFSQYTKYLSEGFGDGSGLAFCNKFQISNNAVPYFSGFVAHPADDAGDPIQEKLVIKVNSLDASFFRQSSNDVGIEFFRIHGGNDSVYHDPDPIAAFVWSDVPNINKKITPAILTQLQILQAPFFIILEGLGTDWNEIGVSVSGISGNNALNTYLLIPSFIANPNEYMKDTSISTQMAQLHPFFSIKDQKKDFVEEAKKFCF